MHSDWMFLLKMSPLPCGSGVGSVQTLSLWPRTSIWLFFLKTLKVVMAAEKRLKTRLGKGAWVSQSETGDKGNGNRFKLRQSPVAEPKGGFTVMFLPSKRVWKGWGLLTCLCCPCLTSSTRRRTTTSRKTCRFTAWVFRCSSGETLQQKTPWWPSSNLLPCHH